jgi:hypothetical protein
MNYNGMSRDQLIRELKQTKQDYDNFSETCNDLIAQAKFYGRTGKMPDEIKVPDNGKMRPSLLPQPKASGKDFFEQYTRKQLISALQSIGVTGITNSSKDDLCRLAGDSYSKLKKSDQTLFLKNCTVTSTS